MKKYGLCLIPFLFGATIVGAKSMTYTYANGETTIVEIPEPQKATTNIPKPVRITTSATSSGASVVLKKVDTNVTLDKAFEHKRNTPVVFSKRTPPNYLKNKTAVGKNAEVGDPKNSRVSLYLRGAALDLPEVKKRLEAAGFTILGVTPLEKKKELISIAFTNDALKKMADMQGRGYAAVLRLLIDKKEKRISILNPLYQSKAFMQNDYDAAVPKAALKRLRDAFASQQLTDSEDMLKLSLLPKYRFMNGMPEYQDMQSIAKGAYAKLLAKAKKSKKVLFIEELSKRRAVVGVKIGKRTGKFIKKTGTKNAALLPYLVLIEGDEAKILDPKYYIALMYPHLKMGQFMKISTVPDAIKKDIKKIFK